ncbi:MAG: type II toxin-antitoxin system VapC family toxin [Halobacteriales archaeon]|nr:type II toxin-antitoxin system VapC family toxin [Halobacteriales archaeon]
MAATEAFVVDASAFAKVFLEQPQSPAFREWRRKALVRGHRLLAPTLLPYELGNVLLREFKGDRGKWEPALTEILLGVLLELPSFPQVFLAAEGLTFYDASYLALAQEHDGTLVSYDRDLLGRATKAGCPVLSPGAK